MMLITVAPALAARTPKSHQIIVKVLNASGKGYAKADVYVEQDFTNARTVVKSTKGNGVVVFSIDKDKLPSSSSWAQTYMLTVWVYHNEVSDYSTFSPYYFDSSYSALIEIQTTW